MLVVRTRSAGVHSASWLGVVYDPCQDLGFCKTITYDVDHQVLHPSALPVGILHPTDEPSCWPYAII